MTSYNMETNQSAIHALEDATTERPKDGKSNSDINTKANGSGHDEPIKTWKQLAQTEKELENTLNLVVEAATELQCDFASLITKTATLFDPNIIEIITSCGSGTIGKPADGDSHNMDENEKELDKNWEEKFASFDKIKRPRLNSKAEW